MRTEAQIVLGFVKPIFGGTLCSKVVPPTDSVLISVIDLPGFAVLALVRRPGSFTY
jgi:hypothetical protein